MTPDGPGAWTASPADIAGRAAALTRIVRTSWQGLTATQFWWTLSVGLIGGMLFLISHSMNRLMSLVSNPDTLRMTILASAVALGMSIVVAFLLLLAVRIAAHGDRDQSRAWPHYVIATFVAVGASTLIVHVLSAYVPIDGLVGWYPLGSQAEIDSFVFANWILFGGLAVLVYVRLARVRRSEAAFARTELDRAAVSRQVLMSQLATMQAQVDATFLFNALSQIEALYERDPANASHILDDLIAYLRAALPQLRGDQSTLARESVLAASYLRIMQARMGSGVEFAFHVPAELGACPFPPMLLMPLIDNAVRHGLEPLSCCGRIEVRAGLHAARLRLEVSDSGIGDATELREGHGLNSLRRRLGDLYGDLATLTLSTTHPHGVTATLEVPANEHTSDHR